MMISAGRAKLSTSVDLPGPTRSASRQPRERLGVLSPLGCLPPQLSLNHPSHPPIPCLCSGSRQLLHSCRVLAYTQETGKASPLGRGFRGSLQSGPPSPEADLMSSRDGLGLEV